MCGSLGKAADCPDDDEGGTDNKSTLYKLHRQKPTNPNSSSEVGVVNTPILWRRKRRPSQAK